MKKTLLITIILAAMTLVLMACGKFAESNDEPREYDVEEFGKLLQDTSKLFAEESEDMMEDELAGEAGCDLYEKCAQEIGLPIKTKVIIKGKKLSGIVGFTLSSSDRKYHVPCIFGDKKKNQSLLIEDGENIAVTGVIVNEEGNHGYLADVTIISPENIEAVFESNISESLANLEDGIKIIQGEVTGICSLEQFEFLMETLPNNNYIHNDDYYDTVIKLGDGKSYIYFMCDSNTFNDLEVGDKVAVQGFVRSLVDTNKLDGTTWVIRGLMGNIQDLYLFD